LLQWHEQGDDVVERGLIAVMPVGALGRVLVEMALIAGGVGRVVVEPLPDAVSAPLQ